MTNEEMQVVALKDQAWAHAVDMRDDIERISRDGIVSDQDAVIAQFCASLVAGDLALHAERRTAEGAA